MRVCVVGCGAIGSIFAVSLAQLEELDVWVFDPSADHVRAINEDGLRITGEAEMHATNITATTDPAELPMCDVGLVATKAIHTAAAISATAPAFREGFVATVQSGIGNEEAIANHVDQVARGTTFHAGKLVGPAHVQWDTRADTTFGPFEPSPATPDAIRLLAATLTRAGIPSTAADDVRGVQWRKAIFSSATNPIGALTGLTHGYVCELPHLRQLVTALVEEGSAVARAQGIVLDSNPLDLLAEAAKPGMYAHLASMLQDVRARRQTEVDYLNGGIVRFGREYGVPTPLNDAALALIKGVERSWAES